MTTPSQEPAIRIAGLRVQYPGATSAALDAETIVIPQGQRTALIGPNGAGKSTLLKAVVGLLPAAGTITVLGQGAAAMRQRIAYVPQRREVDWQFPITAYEVALMGRDAHLRWPWWLRAHDRQVATQALAAVGMSGFATSPIANLSGGQQQRVFLARALAQQAAVLLLDEPFTGVDTATEQVIFALITEVCAAGATVVVATHDLATLSAHFDHVVVLQGRVVASGTPAAVLDPAILATAYGGPLAFFHERGGHGLAA